MEILDKLFILMIGVLLGCLGLAIWGARSQAKEDKEREHFLKKRLPYLLEKPKRIRYVKEIDSKQHPRSADTNRRGVWSRLVTRTHGNVGR